MLPTEIVFQVIRIATEMDDGIGHEVRLVSKDVQPVVDPYLYKTFTVNVSRFLTILRIGQWIPFIRRPTFWEDC